MSERHAVIKRLFLRAAQRLGSAAALARHLGIPYSEVQEYIQGESMPPEAVLLATVQIILDEISRIRAEFPAEVWRSFPLPE